MKYFATLGAVCAIGLSAVGGQAQADIYIFTHSGTVESGVDIYGLFGSQNADLTGTSYAVSYMFDADSLIYEPLSGPGINANNYLADKGLVKITINGKDHYIGPTAVSYELIAAGPPYVSSGVYALTATVMTPGEIMNFQLVSDTQFAGTNELSAPFQYSPTDADLANPLSIGSYWDAFDFKVVFNTKDISLTSQAGGLPAIPTAAVPEPASWALMIVGFGGAGAMLRGRRRVAFA